MMVILVPTDGSPAATKALDLAIDLAKLHRSKIKLLHVLLRDKEASDLVKIPAISADKVLLSALRECEARPAGSATENPYELTYIPVQPAPKELLKAIGKQLLDEARSHAAEESVEVEMMEMVDGKPANAIVDAADAENVDTIVMGMRGLRQIEAIAIGSVSQEVSSRAACTCVAVH
ncbi:MAG: universal stress protein [Hyphomicrobiales bacterium]